MKLHSEDCAVLDHRAERASILSSSNRVDSRVESIGVCEVCVASIRDALQEPGCAVAKLKLVPTYVGDLQPWDKAFAGAGEHTKPGYIGCFFATSEQPLHAQADPQQWNAMRHCIANQLIESGFAQVTRC